MSTEDKTDDGHCSSVSAEATVKHDPDCVHTELDKLITASTMLQHGICRCCLAQGEFEIMEKGNNIAESYLQMLNETFNLTLTTKLIRLICPSCSNILTQAYKFRQRVMSSEKILIEAEMQVKIEIEPIESKDNVQIAHNCSGDNVTNVSTGRLNVKVDPEFKIEIESDFYDDTETNTKIIKEPMTRKTKKANRIKKFKCDICNVGIFTQKQKVRHTTTKHLKCGVCKKVFGTENERDEHLKSHSVQCGVCEAKFENRTMRRKHVQAKHGLKCKICNIHIPVQKKYKHNVECHGAEPFKCGICDKNFYIKFKLVCHQRKVHMRERNAPCAHCDFVAFDATSLRKHMLTHTTEKKHQCEFCNKRFVRKDTLKFHLRIHTGDKRKICKFCGEAFVQRASLKYHLEKYHPGDFY